MSRFLDARRRQIRAKGREMVLRPHAPAGRPPREIALIGFPRLYRPGEIEGALRQGDQQIEILTDELRTVASARLLSEDGGAIRLQNGGVLLLNLRVTLDAPRNPDKLILDGGTTTVQGCRPVYAGAELLGFSLWVRG